MNESDDTKSGARLKDSLERGSKKGSKRSKGSNSQTMNAVDPSKGKRSRIEGKGFDLDSLVTRTRPKRPMSAYNLFFREERARLLEEAANKKDDDNSGSSGEYSGSEENDKKKKKSKVKTHGLISFEELGKSIGRQWRSIDPTTKDRFVKMAQEDSDRYKRELNAFHAAEDAMMNQYAVSIGGDSKPSANESSSAFGLGGVTLPQANAGAQMQYLPAQMESMGGSSLVASLQGLGQINTLPFLQHQGQASGQVNSNTNGGTATATATVGDTVGSSASPSFAPVFQQGNENQSSQLLQALFQQHLPPQLQQTQPQVQLPPHQQASSQPQTQPNSTNQWTDPSLAQCSNPQLQFQMHVQMQLQNLLFSQLTGQMGATGNPANGNVPQVAQVNSGLQFLAQSTAGGNVGADKEGAFPTSQVPLKNATGGSQVSNNNIMLRVSSPRQDNYISESSAPSINSSEASGQQGAQKNAGNSDALAAHFNGNSSIQQMMEGASVGNSSLPAAAASSNSLSATNLNDVVAAIQWFQQQQQQQQQQGNTQSLPSNIGLHNGSK